MLHVTLLGGEWSSSAGGLSTINRELAIHLSNHSTLKVSLLVPDGASNHEEKMKRIPMESLLLRRRDLQHLIVFSG